MGVYHAEFYQSKSTFDEQQVVRDEKVGTRKILESFFETPLDHGDPKKHKVTSVVTLQVIPDAAQRRSAILVIDGLWQMTSHRPPKRRPKEALTLFGWWSF